jgi:hypothetical protein
MNDDFIHQFDPPKPPRPEFTAALYQRISHPVKTTTRTRILRVFALSFATVAVIVTVLFFSPSARAFADSIIQQFQKGNVMIQTVNDAASASQLAGFTVLAPSYLLDGYIANNQPGEWSVVHETDGVMVSINYDNQAANGDIAISEQMGGQAMLNKVMDLPGAQTVTVRGQPGKWISNGGKSFLAWVENGITCIISTNTLPKDEVLKIAESLGK